MLSLPRLALAMRERGHLHGSVESHYFFLHVLDMALPQLMVKEKLFLGGVVLNFVLDLEIKALK